MIKINPTHLMERGFEFNKLVITFFSEVIYKLLGEKMIDNYYYIGGENPIQVYKYTDDSSVLIVLGQVGCPACGGNFDYAALIYGGDDCESEEWSNRDWRSRNGIRYDLVGLCKSLVQII